MGTNTDFVRGIYAAFAKGDIPALVGTFDEKICWTEAEGFPYGGTFTGADAIVGNVFARIGTEWDGFTATPNTFVAEGDTVVALGDYRGTYKTTGKVFSAPFAHVWTLGGGKIVRFHQYTDTALAQAALK